MDKVIFLDRDGTINEEVNYLYKPEDLKIFPGVAKAIRALGDMGFKIVVVTNQAGVARGYYTCEDVERLHEYLNNCLKADGAWIDRFFYCPHHPVYGIGDYKKECSCRKPGTGMFEMAGKEYEIDKEHSYMIGDKLLDVEAGKQFGIHGILVGTGYGAGVHREQMRKQAEKKGDMAYDIYAETLMDAAGYIMEREKTDDGR